MVLKWFILVICTGAVWGESNTYSVIACDGSVQRLNCEKGVLKIRSANYGRTNGYTCSAGIPIRKVTNVRCNHPGAYSVLSQRCDGRKYCELAVGPQQFTDPCANTFKYLNTSYTCLPANISVTCEHAVGELNCGVDVIKVFHATYGRRDGATCSMGQPPRQLANINCFQSRTLQISNRCNGKSRCEVKADNDVFTDPCAGTYKYLEVSYGCLPFSGGAAACGNLNSCDGVVTTCDGSVQRLSCEQGIIKIESARYGRTNGTTCSDGVPAQQLTNVQCNQPEAYCLVSQRCDGTKKCEVSVGPTQFSDPCANTFKYLETSYSCIPANTSVTCEHGVGTLDCGVDFIKIFHTTYGRRDGTTCSAGRPANQLANVNCFLSRTLQVSNSCDGKHLCSVTATDQSFPDPCFGTYKYLEVSYSCYSAKTSITCDGATGALSCGNDYIKVFHATYGRRDGTTCSSGRPANQVAVMNCYQPRTLQISSSCDGKNLCSVTATDQSFPDPCFGTYKYLEVTYGCYPPKRSITCESFWSSLDCGNDIIRILEANYGRRNSTICTTGRPRSQLENVNCLQPQTFALMSDRCNGKSRCDVLAENGIFADPCFGTYKYLEVSYSCLSSNTS